MAERPSGRSSRTVLGKSLTVVSSVALAFAVLLESLAIHYSNLPDFIRPAATAVFAATALMLLLQGFRQPDRRKGLLILLAAVSLWWWLCIPPANDRDWQPDVKVLPWAEIRGDIVTVHNIRNAEYRTETDYTVRHYIRTFDLRQLQSVDFFLVFWGSPSIAHTMLSFGFRDGSYLCISIETRKEVGEAYSAVKGFFKQFELTYVVADERDVVRLRTNYREKGKGEDVYLYRLNVPASFARKLFLDYLREVNSLKDRPEWYRALSGNCTTTIRRHTGRFNPHPIYDWRIIVNGYVDEMLYERKLIDHSLPFAELKRRSSINDKARSANDSDDFSTAIRAGLPGMAP